MTASEKRNEAARLMKSRAGKNKYTQGGDRIYFFGKPEGKNPGYSDCSSSVQAAIKRAAGINIGGNTSAQVANRAKGIMVEDNRNGKRTYPDESKMLPSDCVYFKGNVSHVWDVGHVEMYTGSGTLHGHGGGTGPAKHDLKTYSKSRTGSRAYLCTIRWIKDDTTVVPADPVKDTPVTTPEHGIKITGGTVNLRTGPSTDYSIVDTASAGEKFEDASSAGWLPIVKNGRILWVSNTYAVKY